MVALQGGCQVCRGDGGANHTAPDLRQVLAGFAHQQTPGHHLSNSKCSSDYHPRPQTVLGNLGRNVLSGLGENNRDFDEIFYHTLYIYIFLLLLLSFIRHQRKIIKYFKLVQLSDEGICEATKEF